MFFWGLLLILMSITLRAVRHSASSNTKRSHSDPHPSLHGTSTLIPNVTVYGAVIMSNIELIYDHSQEPTGNQSTASSLSSNGRHAQLGRLRLEHVRNMSRELPFPLVYWPAVYSKPCPQRRHGHKTERGLALAHSQIWSDFV